MTASATKPLDFSDITGKKKKVPENYNVPLQSSYPDPEPQQKENLKQYSPQQAMGYPVQQTGEGDELLQLFPIPVMISPYPVNYDKELEWIRNQPCRKDNRGGGNNCAPGGMVQHYNRQSEETFILDKPELSNVRAFIEAKLHKYVTEIMSSNDKLVITQSWLNKSGKGESHHEHVHPNSMISGVWFPQIHEQMPPIQFRGGHQRDVALQSTKFNTFNSATFMLPMKKGELLLFPSNLSHSVPVNQGDEERISLSFNTWPKGNMGDKQSLTYLPLERCV